MTGYALADRAALQDGDTVYVRLADVVSRSCSESSFFARATDRGRGFSSRLYPHRVVKRDGGDVLVVEGEAPAKPARMQMMLTDGTERPLDGFDPSTIFVRREA